VCAFWLCHEAASCLLILQVRTLCESFTVNSQNVEISFLHSSVMPGSMLGASNSASQAVDLEFAVKLPLIHFPCFGQPSHCQCHQVDWSCFPCWLVSEQSGIKEACMQCFFIELWKAVEGWSGMHVPVWMVSQRATQQVRSAEQCRVMLGQSRIFYSHFDSLNGKGIFLGYLCGAGTSRCQVGFVVFLSFRVSYLIASYNSR